MIPIVFSIILVALIGLGFYFAQKKPRIPVKDRICVKCRFCDSDNKKPNEFICKNPAFVNQDRVTGEPMDFTACKFERKSGLCDYEGKYFEPK